MSMKLYKDTPALEDKLFKNPTAEYRGTPFWAWNGKLNEEYLSEQIDCFKKMGFGGAHMHVRTGFSEEYLGKVHMDAVAFCTEKFKKEKMLSWLYDEDRYPSGFAGGYVTKEDRYKIKRLLLTKTPMTGNTFTYLTSYDIILDDEGYLVSYSRIGFDDEAKGDKRHCYIDIETAKEDRYNGLCYADLLMPEATEKFIEITHEKYKKKVGKHFGKTIPSMFTDEPNFFMVNSLKEPFEQRNLRIPWTFDFADTYKEVYGEDILDGIPEIFWEKSGGDVSAVRYKYYDHLSERFTSGFSDICGKWCEENGILFTGHMLGEESLETQVQWLGDCMRNYRSYSLPGIDLLFDGHEYTTAKQCQSAVHQYGRCGMMSELYGVTNWDFDFRGHKLQGDWQAALGVTVRVPHLSLYSMAGAAKRDYPASISYQSPWHEKYKLVEDHFSRVNTAMTRGKPVVKIGVIHPVESYWLIRGPLSQTAGIREKMETQLQQLCSWLIFGSADFDYIAESLLPSLCREGGSPLEVGEMKYDAIIVPDCLTLRKTTVERLEKFRACGGKLIFLGNAPKYCDAVPSERVLELYEKSEKVAFDKYEILTALSGVCDVKTDSSEHICQLREEKDGTRWLFVANGKGYDNPDIPTSCELTVTLKGEYTPVLYDTMTGKIWKIPFDIRNGSTVIKRIMYNHDSLLLKLEKYDGNKICEKQSELSRIPLKFPHKNEFALSEDNVFVLDMASYKVNGKWHDDEEVLRIDEICRKLMNLPRLSTIQPWVNIGKEVNGSVTLRFEINSQIKVSGAKLAFEKAEETKIKLNRRIVESRVTGYFTDKHIKTVELPELKKGKNILELTYTLGTYATLEYAYILGAFGVCAVGRDKVITALPEKLSFDDVRNQGLAFYGANVTYKCDIETPESGTLVIHSPVYRGALIGVKLDGKDAGEIIYSPYDIKIPSVKAGSHTVELILFGNRFNTFGQIHMHHHKTYLRYGPASYRTTGDEFYYEYETKPMGVLRTPVAYIEK